MKLLPGTTEVVVQADEWTVKSFSEGPTSVMVPSKGLELEPFCGRERQREPAGEILSGAKDRLTFLLPSKGEILSELND